MSISIFEVKHDIRCNDCKCTIRKDKLAFKPWGKSWICAKCVQPAIDIEIEKHQNKILDLKNLKGKVYIIAQDYRKEVGSEDYSFCKESSEIRGKEETNKHSSNNGSIKSSK